MGASLPTKDRIVLCIRWGTLYPADYVNVLFNAVSANLSGPFRFVCLTDDGRGLHKEIEVFPIPDMGLAPERFARGAWPKLALFKQDLYGLQGRMLFVDLDTVVNGPIDQFFEANDPFLAISHSTWEHRIKTKPRVYLAWKAWRGRVKAARTAQSHEGGDPSAQVAPNKMSSCVFALDVGSQSQVYDAFMADPETAFQRYSNEQHFLELHLERWTPWPRHSIISYKFQLRRPLIADWFLHPKVPPKQVPMVAFHGDPRPLAMAVGWHSSAREFPHVWIGPVRWMRDYWRRYSHTG